MHDWIFGESEPADSREAIMQATFAAAQKHGYTELSIQRIADEADLSKSTFYHHFDDKEDLLQSFVEYVLEEFTVMLRQEAGDSPEEFVQTYVDLMVNPEEISFFDCGFADELLGAYVQLRAQAVKDEGFRAQFTKTDHRFEEQLTSVIREGIEAGVFREVDPESAATMILTLDMGHIFRRATRDDDPSGALEPELQAYVDERLLGEQSVTSP